MGAPLATLLVLTVGAALCSASSSPTASLTTSASASTAPPGARLTATPKVVLVGQPVQLSGTGCPRRDEVVTGLTAPVIPRRDGTWKVDETVGILDPVGPRDFGADCFTRGGGSMVFRYPLARVRVSMSPPPGARFTVSPKTLMVGGPVHFTGTDCPHGDHVATDYGDISPRADGSWSVDATVDQGSAIGSVAVDAECLATPSQYEVFTYRPIKTQVNTFRHLRVSPAVVHAGTTTLTVDSVGPCPVGAGSSGGSTSGYWAEVTLSQGGDAFGGGYTADSIQQFVSGREWSAILPIPGGLVAGQYELTAICVIQRLTLGYYRPLTINVTDAPTPGS